MTNELYGTIITFDAPGYPPFPVYGQVFLETIGMDIGNQTRNLVCLTCLAVGFTLASYLLLLMHVPSMNSTSTAVHVRGQFRTIMRDPQKENAGQQQAHIVQVQRDESEEQYNAAKVADNAPEGEEKQTLSQQRVPSLGKPGGLSDVGHGEKQHIRKIYDS
jgi:hypothetical protein